MNSAFDEVLRADTATPALTTADGVLTALAICPRDIPEERLS